MINTIFLGSPFYVVPVLNTLLLDPHINLQLVITQPDRPLGRKKTITPTPVKQFAQQHQIPVFTPEKITHDIQNQILSLIKQPLDLAVLAAYGHIIPDWLLTLPTHGFINLHPSLLPKFRGAMPTLGPLIRGETSTGLTYMQMDSELDHGSIIAQFSTSINQSLTTDQLTTQLFEQSTHYLSSIITNYISQTQPPPSTPYQLYSPPKVQPHELATFTPRLDKTDAQLPWTLIANSLAGQPSQLHDFPHKLQPLIADLFQPHLAPKFTHQTIHALSSWPTAWTIIPATFTNSRQDLRVKLLSSSYETTTNTLKLNQIQQAGKNPQPWIQFQSTLLKKTT